MSYGFLRACFPLIPLLALALYIQYQKHKYQDLVKHCCYDTALILTTNQLLPDAYKIYTSEERLFQSLHCAYRDWLLARYLNKGLDSVLDDYQRICSWRNRKIYHLEQLRPYFGASVKKALFYLETVNYFIWICERDNKIGDFRFYNTEYNPEDDTLTDIGIVAYKVMLSAHIARNLLGYDNSYAIDAANALIDKSQP